MIDSRVLVVARRNMLPHLESRGGIVGRITGQDTVHLVLADGAQVEWGSADDTALKARVLQTLRAAPASAGAAVYDVSAPTMPITRAQP